MSEVQEQSSGSIDVKKTKEVVIHLSNLMEQMDTIKEDIKIGINEQSKELNIDKKTLRRMVMTYHKQNFSKTKTETEEFIDVYEGVMNS